MRIEAVRNLVYAQACFFGFLIIAIIINPATFSANHGLSYLGEHIKSAIPFGLGILTCDYFLLRTADQLNGLKGGLKNLPAALRWLAVFFILIFVTPDTLNSAFDWSHIIASTFLFVYELGLTGWLTFYHSRRPASVLLFSLQLAAALVTMLSQLHKIYYLSEGILSFQLLTGLLLVQIFSRLAQIKPLDIFG